MSQRQNDFLFNKNFPNEDNIVYKQPPMNFPNLDKEFDIKPNNETLFSLNKPPENIRLYVTLKKSVDSNIEYKKMILMISSIYKKQCSLINNIFI